MGFLSWYVHYPSLSLYDFGSLDAMVTYPLCLCIASCLYARKARITNQTCVRLEMSRPSSREMRTTMMGRMTACNSVASRQTYALSLEHYQRTPHLPLSFLGPLDIAILRSGTEIERLSRYPAFLMCRLFHIKIESFLGCGCGSGLLFSFNAAQNTPNPSLTTAT